MIKVISVNGKDIQEKVMNWIWVALRDFLQDRTQTRHSQLIIFVIIYLKSDFSFLTGLGGKFSKANRFKTNFIKA